MNEVFFKELETFSHVLDYVDCVDVDVLIVLAVHRRMRR